MLFFVHSCSLIFLTGKYSKQGEANIYEADVVVVGIVRNWLERRLHKTDDDDGIKQTVLIL